MRGRHSPTEPHPQPPLLFFSSPNPLRLQVNNLNSMISSAVDWEGHTLLGMLFLWGQKPPLDQGLGHSEYQVLSECPLRMIACL